MQRERERRREDRAREREREGEREKGTGAWLLHFSARDAEEGRSHRTYCSRQLGWAVAAKSVLFHVCLHPPAPFPHFDALGALDPGCGFRRGRRQADQPQLSNPRRGPKPVMSSVMEWRDARANCRLNFPLPHSDSPTNVGSPSFFALPSPVWSRRN